MSSLAALQQLIHQKYGLEPGTVDPNVSMKDSGLDSLAIAEFIFDVEDHFGISVPEERLTGDTLSGLATLVDELLQEKAQAGSTTVS